MMDKSTHVFQNPMDAATIAKGISTKNSFVKKFGVDDPKELTAITQVAPVLGDRWKMKTIGVQKGSGDGENLGFPTGQKPIVIGTIRMGYGHFRISMAIASAAYSMGYTPYWFDLHSFTTTVAGKIVGHLNSLYSLGSRLSQKYALFNKFYWEPLNSEGFKQLSYNSVDQRMTELMAPVLSVLPDHIPFIATHVWPAQAALHRGMKRVVNVIPDNWPMGLHLAEGAIHTVQTPSAMLGYTSLRGMYGKAQAQPIPPGMVVNTGHYVDHEMLASLNTDCAGRIERCEASQPMRILASIGGAGAQLEFLLSMIQGLKEELVSGKVELWINTGDHRKVRDTLLDKMSTIGLPVEAHDNSIDTPGLAIPSGGNHVFFEESIFAAVYRTNLLMTACDLLVTKPSELAFYPVPKLLIKRIGGHEAWGAIRAAEIGDGTYEVPDTAGAVAMVRLMLKDKGILKSMNTSIMDQNKIGTYNGAYRAVELSQKGD